MVRDASAFGTSARAALAQPRMQQAAMERCALLEALLLLYYSRPLSADRWLELAGAVRSSLVLQGWPPAPHNGAGRCHERRADHLVRLFLPSLSSALLYVSVGALRCSPDILRLGCKSRVFRDGICRPFITLCSTG